MISQAWAKESDLGHWQQFTLNMADKIREICLTEAKNGIVRLANHRFKLRTLQDKQIVNWSNVTLYTNRTGYVTDLELGCIFWS